MKKLKALSLAVLALGFMPMVGQLPVSAMFPVNQASKRKRTEEVGHSEKYKTRLEVLKKLKVLAVTGEQAIVAPERSYNCYWPSIGRMVTSDGLYNFSAVEAARSLSEKAVRKLLGDHNVDTIDRYYYTVLDFLEEWRNLEHDDRKAVGFVILKTLVKGNPAANENFLNVVRKNLDDVYCVHLDDNSVEIGHELIMFEFVLKNDINPDEKAMILKAAEDGACDSYEADEDEEVVLNFCL